MERGTSREREAAREQGESLERRRQMATRLLRGLAFVGIGTVLLLLVVAQRVCFATVRGAVSSCTPTTFGLAAAALLVVGVAALCYGVWTWWSMRR